MAQEFAHKIPKDIPSDCDQCGYMPKLEDVSVILPEFTGNEIVYHVRCYHCGHEWVDQYTYVYTTFMYTQPFAVYMAKKPKSPSGYERFMKRVRTDRMRRACPKCSIYACDKHRRKE